MSTDDGGTRRPYPDEPKMQMTEDWKKAVDRALEQQGKTRSWLADELGVDKGAVTRMLSPDQNTSSMVKRVCELLGLPEPVAEIKEQWEHEVLSDLRQLAADDRELIRAQIQRYKRDPR